MDAAEKRRGRPFTGSGLSVSSPLQVWQLRVDNFMIMIALYLPQLHEEGCGSEFTEEPWSPVLADRSRLILKLRERGSIPLG
jgi:hypothetical protein